MKKILIGIGIFLVFSFILGLIINSVDNSANKPNPYKSSYRTAFVNPQKVLPSNLVSARMIVLPTLMEIHT